MAIEYRIEHDVACVLINRESRRNALDLDTLDELRATIDGLPSAGARALVIGGVGRTFCAGADLGVVDPSGAVPRRMLAAVSELLLRMRTLRMPVIAAWEGPAVGAGAGLALAADLRVLAESATLVTGHLRIGSPPDGGLSWFMVRAFGTMRAMSLMLRSATVTAAELVSAGLAEALVPDGSAVLRATELARELAGSSAPLAVAGLRDLIDASSQSDLAQQLESEARWIHASLQTKDFHEGVAAFLERRPPRYVGE